MARSDQTCRQSVSRRYLQPSKAGKIGWKSSRIRCWKRAMIRRKSSPPSSYLATPPPETPPSFSTATSDCDADDEDTMSTEDSTPSRPPSAAGSHADQQAGPYAPSRPTLPDVLSNSAPPPWTLSAFTAYLSQNHCLENLEFTTDADRYRKQFHAMRLRKSGAEVEDHQYLRMLWQRLLDAYIIPDGSREINIPTTSVRPCYPYRTTLFLLRLRSLTLPSLSSIT